MKLVATRAVTSNIPISILSFMFDAICRLNERDYLHVFDITSKHEEVTIVHTQEQPQYKQEYSLTVERTFSCELFAVIDDEYCTFMYAEEY